jgi:DnaJ-class molecular chaperone
MSDPVKVTVPCVGCGGTGKIKGEKCTRCDGKGTVAY